MKKKITLIFLSLMILTYPIYFAINPQYAHAIGTKVATKVATQAVKEVIKDAAKEQAFKMALDEVGKIYDPDNKYKFKDGYSGYCVEVKKPDGTCDKPIQIKKDITEADQKKLDESVSKKLDQKIGGQLYNTKWGKYLDYVIPIYAVSAVGATVDYAINGEDSILGMMNEVAMEALEDSGVILQAELVKPNIVDDNGLELEEGEKTVIETTQSIITLPYKKHYEIYMDNISTKSSPTLFQARVDLFAEPDADNFVFEIVPVNREHEQEYSNLSLWWGLDSNDTVYRNMFSVSDGRIGYTEEIGKTTVTYNGLQIHLKDSTSGGNNIAVNNAMIRNSGIERILLDYPLEDLNNDTTKKHILYMKNGDIISISLHGKYQRKPTDLFLRQQLFSGQSTAIRFIQYAGGGLQFIPFIPEWSEVVSNFETTPVEMTVFKSYGDTIVMPPAASMEYTGINGEPLTIVKDPVTGETAFQYPDGSPVEEDAVQVTPGTGYSKVPNGYTYTPTNPTPENPTRQPEIVVVNPPETETPTDPNNPNPDPQPDPNNPPPTIPDGESCEEGFKFPELTPLVASMEDNFPLSIPFDIQAAFNAAFGQMGEDKPEWNLVIAGAEMKIKIPDFFDRMKPFTDSLLLFIFNIGMIFGIMRIMKGMN